MKRVVCLYWIFFLIQSCRVNQPPGLIPDITEDKLPDEIVLYLVFEISKTDSAQTAIELIQVNRAAKSGRMSIQEEAVEEKQLFFHFLDQNQALLKEERIDNPLFKSYESYAESGQIERIKGALNKSKIVLRVNVSEEVTFVKVSDHDGLLKVFEL